MLRKHSRVALVDPAGSGNVQPLTASGRGGGSSPTRRVSFWGYATNDSLFFVRNARTQQCDISRRGIHESGLIPETEKKYTATMNGVFDTEPLSEKTTEELRSLDLAEKTKKPLLVSRIPTRMKVSELSDDIQMFLGLFTVVYPWLCLFLWTSQPAIEVTLIVWSDGVGSLMDATFTDSFRSGRLVFIGD